MSCLPGSPSSAYVAGGVRAYMHARMDRDEAAPDLCLSAHALVLRWMSRVWSRGRERSAVAATSSTCSPCWSDRVMPARPSGLGVTILGPHGGPRPPSGRIILV